MFSNAFAAKEADRFASDMFEETTKAVMVISFSLIWFLNMIRLFLRRSFSNVPFPMLLNFFLYGAIQWELPVGVDESLPDLVLLVDSWVLGTVNYCMYSIYTLFL